MNLLADESVEGQVVERLRRDGHDVIYVAELAPSIVDEEVPRQANAHGAVLVTADKDFGELVFRQGLVHSGVVLLRLAGLANVSKAEIVAEVCRLRAAELIGAFTESHQGRFVFGGGPDAPDLERCGPTGAARRIVARTVRSA